MVDGGNVNINCTPHSWHYSMYKFNDDTVWYIILSGGYSVIAIIWQRGNKEVSQLAIAL